jgi:hypothetical protein
MAIRLTSIDTSAGLAMTPATKQQLLARGAKLLGREELAKRLNMPCSLLEAWLCGTATMPDGKLLDLARLFDDISREDKLP